MELKHIYIIGGISSGKTSLANVILREPILPIDFHEQSEITIHYAAETEGIKAKCIEGAKDSIISFCTEYDSISKEKLQALYDNSKTKLIELFSNYSFLSGLSEKPAIHLIPAYSNENWLKWVDLVNSINIEESLILFLFRDAYLTNSVTTLLSDLQSVCRSQHSNLTKHCLFILNGMDSVENEQEISEIIDHFNKELRKMGIEDAKVYPLSLTCYINYFMNHKHGGIPLKSGIVISGTVISNTVLHLLWQSFRLHDIYNLDNYVPHLVNNKDYKEYKIESLYAIVLSNDYAAKIKLYSGLTALEYTIQAIIKNIFIQ